MVEIIRIRRVITSKFIRKTVALMRLDIQSLAMDECVSVYEIEIIKMLYIAKRGDRPKDSSWFK